MSDETVLTRSVVTITIEITGTTDAWDPSEPMTRPLKEAKPAAMNVLHRILKGEPLKGDREKIKIVRVNDVKVCAEFRGKV